MMPILSRGAKSFAPRFHPGLDQVPHSSGFFQSFLRRTLKAGWVGKPPMQTSHTAWKNRTTFRAGFVADGDDVIKLVTAREEVRDRFRLMTGNVNADFADR